jgi:ferredoxin-NADP reductase/DMSO/TMAO reductase YedYZ heme-binding membrane subunit
MTLSVVWGILLSTRILRRIDNPGWLQDLHRFLGGLSVIMVLLHMVTLMLDGWLKFTPTELLVPFTTDFKPIATALGILAFYLLIAVQGSSMIMNRLPRKFWKGLHYASYAIVLIVSFHAGLSGTDVGSLGYRILAFSLIGLTAAATVVRIAVTNRTNTAAKAEVWVPPHSTTPRMSPPLISTRTMVVTNAALISGDVLGVRLVALGGGLLPIWYPGAHVTLHLSNGLERQYSLCGDPGERHHYDLAVLRTEDSAGGSAWVHEKVEPGTTIEVSGPLNHFELEPAREYLFIAGGIGITPIKAMIESLPAPREWRLIYVGRSRATMAFAAELESRWPDRVRVHAVDEALARLDFSRLVTADTTEVYCCGPESLMAEVAGAVPSGRLHVERFIPIERAPSIPDQPLQLSFSRDPAQLTVGSDESVLDALVRVGMPVIGSCRKGVCGTCEVKVVSGTPEHLDSVMDDSEKDRLGIMYPCVSRALSRELVLDF